MRILLVVVGLLMVWFGPMAASRADTVAMVFPPYQPPYILLGGDDTAHTREGIMLDIIRESLALKGHTLEPRMVPYNRFATELESGKVQAVGYMKGDLPSLFASQESIHFTNAAITHKADTRELSSLADLAGRKLVTWQGAEDDLGQDFAAMIPSMALYKEMADQARQTRVFVLNRADVIVLDEYIFRYFARSYEQDLSDFVYNDIVGGRLGFSTGFVSEQIRDDFDEGLAKLKESGRYLEIYNYYANDYVLTREE
ncbi:MAG: transporter substrate-binding domain-containing protein [Halioglobus sp.]